MGTLDKILEEINNANSIVILTHENPDGDAIGTSLALYNSLKLYGKSKVDLIIPECPKTFMFLPGAEEIKKTSEINNYDLAIAIDCASFDMLCEDKDYFENAESTTVIDHHGTNTMYGDFNFVNPDAPACAEVMIVALNKFGIHIDKNIGTCLLVGIITDTGGFKYQGVTAETFEFVARLLNKGVNVSNTYRKVLQVKTRSSFELSRVAGDRLEFFNDGKVAFTYVTLDDYEKFGCSYGDHEGIVDIGRDIEGVEVSIFVREIQGKGLKVSLRSNEAVDVDEIALLYGGGGHQKAAGFSTKGDIESVKEMILQEVRHYLYN
ncbi:MAG: bifunctional oligoribonuclease/PAP phosphatase NrnA [Clostridia bacterium]|nr:bifunctional oligoribonuclease/PAP phosphatase NrnA [Clostridia bacterium]